MRVTVAALLMWTAGASSGCMWHGHRLIPASSAHRVAGRSPAAVEGAAGVQVLVEVEAWPHDAVQLDRSVTPIRVTVENRSGAAVLVRHDEFALLARGDRSYAALAPDEVPVENADRPVTITQPIFGPAGMAGGDSLRPMPPGTDAADNGSRRETSFPYNAYYFRGYTVTPDVRRMQAVARALPEGVVPAGGTVRGFVYFASSVYRERRVVFEATLVKDPAAASEGVGVAQVRVPFRVR